jgi:O-Antigen ligase
MPEYLKALVVIVVAATIVFALARRPLCPGVMAQADFVRRRNLWLGITLTAFLAHNFWIFVVLVAALVVASLPRERNKLALFLFLAFVVPAFSAQIPGFGLIERIFPLSYPRLLGLLVLVPAFVALISRSDSARFGSTVTDKFVIAYVLLEIGFEITFNSLTGSMRASFLLLIGILLPYYVASRALRDPKAFRDALGSLVLASTLLAVLAALESARHWLLYAQLDEALGLNWTFGKYLGRGDNLRATATMGHSIALGYLMAIALCVYVYVSRFIDDARFRWLGWAVLLVGLLAPLARGPWVGAAAGACVIVALGAQPLVRIGRMLGGLALAIPLVLVSPYGDNFLRYIPFLGTGDEGSISYRQQLLETSLQFIAQSPLLGLHGSADSSAFEELRQGEGIIDIVNTYISVALATGVVGLFLFSGVFVAAGAAVWLRLRRSAPGSEQELLGRAILGALVAVVVTIGTTSSISTIALIYWLVVGMAVAYAGSPVPVRAGAKVPADSGPRASPALRARV